MYYGFGMIIKTYTHGTLDNQNFSGEKNKLIINRKLMEIRSNKLCRRQYFKLYGIPHINKLYPIVWYPYYTLFFKYFTFYLILINKLQT